MPGSFFPDKVLSFYGTFVPKDPFLAKFALINLHDEKK